MMPAISQFSRRFRSAASSALRAGLDFVYPRVCPRCGSEDQRISSTRELEPVFCSACRDELAPPIPHACRRCAAPVGPYLDTSSGCAHCRKERFAFQRVVRLGIYEGALRSLCLLGKEPGSEPLLAAAASLLCERETESLAALRADLVVPVPHHWSQRIGRPHNPAELLAGLLAKRLGVESDPHVVRKVRRTPPQASLPATRRRTNLRGAFRAARGCDLSGCRIVIFDDVLTTGSTAHEVARALRSAGGEIVAAAVLARAVAR